MNKATLSPVLSHKKSPHPHVDAARRIDDTFDTVLEALRFELILACDRAGIDITDVIKNASPRVRDAFSHERSWQREKHTLSEIVRYGHTLQLTETAMRVSARMPSYIVSILSKALRRKRKQLSTSTIAVLGTSPRHTMLDAESQVLDILKDRGAVVRTYDPDTALEDDAMSLALQDADAALILRTHPFLCALTPFHFMRAGVSIVVDAPNCLRKDDFKHSGVHYSGLGRGTI